MHTCPMVTGVVPHVGGPILPPGCPTVLVGMMPAARLGDMCVCVGPPDSIAMGSPTVQMGSMMAARLGDPTVHGGVIVFGWPTVMPGIAASCFPGSVTPLTDLSFELQPDGSAVGRFGASITVEGTPEFVAKALGNLTALSALESGQSVITSLGSKVVITECGPGGDGAGLGSGNWNNPDLYNDTGVEATVSHYPNQQVVYDGSEAWMTMPPHVVLGHELAHASHITNGDVTGNPVVGPAIPNDTSGLPEGRGREERRTVGLGADADYDMPDYTAESFSENSVRRDQGLPERTRYTATEW
jgi:uncharacterized Zn-binding protein involved in type VI secretion